ncbi:Female sterile M3-like protein [Daphnia magna]|uniref:Female sterile M3-like protein n=1 Tax=Daphnia magna TaxID=35525 RepID=A0A164T2S1_9CRUS|nr:Female sterile M3-like protein [Daphnia magna]
MVHYCIINGRDYDEFSRQAWRYSSSEHTVPHVWVGDLKAENVLNGSPLEDHCPHKSEKEQNFTGSVRIVGTVQVVESFRSDWINGINVYVLPGVLVDKNAHQIGIKQTILASIEVDVLDVQGNIDCPDINGRNVDDFLYTDEDDTRIVLGRVRISDDLVMENGSFNSVDLIKWLDPQSLWIDSNINANGDLAAHAAHVQKIYTIDLLNLPQNYWTKSTDQSIPVNLTIHGNLAVEETFNNLNIPQGITLLDRSIRHSGTLFTSNVTVYGDVVSSAGYVIALSMEAGVMLDDFVAAAATIDEDATIIEHLRATNAQNLTDFVLIAGTSDVQPITGPMDIQRVTEPYEKTEPKLLPVILDNAYLVNYAT